jgi:putative transposase
LLALMRNRRFKVEGRGAVYHCISRVVGGEFLLEDFHKEQLKRMLWRQAQFCGVEIVTYCVMANHFHVLIRIPDLVEISDEVLVHRVLALYGRRVPWVEALVSNLETNGSIDQGLRDTLIRRMGDVSLFMKELKKRFSNWYNKYHGRFGTLWAERFKSILVQDQPSVVSLVAAYVDLNPVRAGLVADPKDYRFSGYGEAVAGSEMARRGLLSFLDAGSWLEGAKSYRKGLFVRGGVPGRSGGKVLDKPSVLKVFKEGGVLSMAAALQVRMRYMTDSAVLGSELFVNQIFSEFRDQFSKQRKTGARQIRGADLGNIRSMRDLQVDLYT